MTPRAFFTPTGRSSLVLLALLCLPDLASGALSAAEMPCHHEAASEPVVEVSPSTIELPAVTLVDQDGRSVELTSFARGKWVAVNFIFTTCTTICPPMGANFAKLDRELGERLGRDVELVSISIDPTVDTPARLKAWRNKFGVEAGWTLLTGAKPQVDRVLRVFGVTTGSPSSHTPLLFVGRGSGSTWQRLYGMTPPAEVVATLGRLAELEGGSSEKGVGR